MADTQIHATDATSDHCSGPQIKLLYSILGFSAPDPSTIDRVASDRSNIVTCDGVMIVKISPDVVVKFGSHVTLNEAKSMIYVEQNLESVPVPKIYAYYTYGPIDRDLEDYGSLFDTYIFMSFVEGQTLDTVWDSYDQNTKMDISNQLKASFQEIRSLGHGTFIGSADRGPVTDQILSNFHNKGPFESEEAFNTAIIDAYQSAVPKRHIRNFLIGMLSEKDHSMVFSHGDLRPQNILVKDGKVTGIIDWEFSGWYPEYWEFVKALYVWTWQNDWTDYLLKILQPYYAQYAFHSFLTEMLW